MSSCIKSSQATSENSVQRAQTDGTPSDYTALFASPSLVFNRQYSPIVLRRHGEITKRKIEIVKVVLSGIKEFLLCFFFFFVGNNCLIGSLPQPKALKTLLTY